MSCEPTGEPETTDRAGKEQYEYLHIQRRRSIYALVSHGLYEIAFLAAIELRESSRGGERAPQGAFEANSGTQTNLRVHIDRCTIAGADLTSDSLSLA